MKQAVYLAGAITGVEDANVWRTEATRVLESLGFEVINPVLVEAKTITDSEVVLFDYRAILKSAMILVDARAPSWGTAMELLFAFQNDIPAIAWGIEDPSKVSPWLRRHTSAIEPSLRHVFFNLGMEPA